jgi:hypothetical protein
MQLALSRVGALGFGLLMVTLPAIGTSGPSLIAAAIAVIMALVGTVFRPAATLAVLSAVVVVIVANPSPMLAAVSGLSAAAYLAVRHTDAGVITVAAPTMIAAAGFTFAGLIATSFPLRIPWVPLLAPLAVVGIYALAIYPYLGARD